MAEVNGKTYKADVKVAEKAAAPAATTTSKLQEFANYIKSKGKLQYGDTTKVKNNYEIKNDTSKDWTVLPERATNIGYEKNQSKILIFRKGKNVQHVFEITADANNLYFKVQNNFEEIDVRFINTDTAKPYVDEDKKILDGRSDDYKKDPTAWIKKMALMEQAYYTCGFFRDGVKKGIDGDDWEYDKASDTLIYMMMNEKRYAPFGNIRDISSMTVTVPLNGNAAKATFAHNTDVDFRSGAGTSKAFYSEYTYQFNIANYNPEGAYGWTLTSNSKNDLQDGHDYIDMPKSSLWNTVYGADNYVKMVTDEVKFSTDWLVNPSLYFSRMLSGLLNTIDAMMVDYKTGFDLKTIGFNAYTNLDRNLYTNTMLLTRALYNARWDNIFWY
jgi:hypothetical protein